MADDGPAVHPPVGDPGGTQADLRDALEGLPQAAVANAGAIAAGLAHDVRGRAVDLGMPDRDWLWAALERAMAANVPLMLERIASGGDPPGDPPAETVAFARAAARAGVPIGDMLQILRIAQASIYQRGIDLAADVAADDATARAIVDRSMATTIRYHDWLARTFADIYREHEEAGADLRLSLVTAVLSGQPVSRAALAYDLEATHVAVVAHGAGAAEAVSALAAGTDRQVLAVSPAGDMAWGWLGGTRTPDEAQLRRLAATVLPGGVTAGIGEPAAGPEGFRSSHAQALLAHRHARTAGAPTRHRDVALVVALLRDRAAARGLVEDELRPLGTDARGQRLRETLRALFATGNAASAAAKLDVSPRTVSYRIQEAEGLLGCSITSRRTELDVALRLEAALAGDG